MTKKQKQLEKALKLAGIDKEKFDQVVDLLSDEDDEQEETVETEKVEPKVEETKENPKEEKEVVEETKKDVDYDEILKKLGIDQIKEVVVKQNEEIEKLKKQVEKSTPAGAKQKATEQTNDDEDFTFDKLFNELSNQGVTYRK